MRPQQLSRLCILTVLTAAGLFFLIALLSMSLTPAATAARPGRAPHLLTPTPSNTPTTTLTITPTATLTPTATITPTATLTPTATVTPTATPVLTAGGYLPAVAAPAATPTQTPTATATCLPNPPLPPSDEAVDEDVAIQIIQVRGKHGLNAYLEDEQLAQAARRHAHDMADNEVFSHTGSDGSTAAQRIHEACYAAAWSSEIIGWGFSTAEAMFDWWLSSETHRHTILHPNLEEMGIAYLQQPGSSFTHYWVVVFAKPAALADGRTPPYTCTIRIMEADRGMSIQWRQERPCANSLSPGQ